MKILALTKYGDAAASTRQRFLQYRPALEQAGFDLEISPLLGNRHVERIAEGLRGSPLAILGSYARRINALLRNARGADALWVHCELFPYFPALLERLAFVSGKPVVFDYDDAIFHMYDSMPLLRQKLGPLIAGASAISAGNDYLADYALRWNKNVHVVPTVVDTGLFTPLKASSGGPSVVGWIGSTSTWKYVRPMLPVIEQLCADGRLNFLAVGGGREAEQDLFNGMTCREWSEEREIADVQAMDIGIMPLPDEPWARGKCGYKLIQYMACGLPVVASPVGVNASIVRNRESGFLVTTSEEWRNALQRLADDWHLRATFGAKGRERAVRDYSLESQAPRVVELFERVVAPGAACLQRATAAR